MALVVLTMPVREVTLWEFGAAHGRIGDMVLAASFALWFTSASLRGRFGIVRNRLDILVATFLTLYALSIVWTPNIDSGLVRVGKLLRNGMLYILLGDYLLTDFNARYRKVAACLVLSGLFQSIAFGVSLSQHGLVALAVLMEASSLPSSDPVLSAVRFDQGGGLFLKGVGYWLPMCIFAAVSLAPSIKTWIVSTLNWVLIFAMGILVLLSGTRGSWLGTAAGFGLIAAFSLPRLTLAKAAVITLWIAVIGAGAVSLGAHNFVMSRFNVDTIEGDAAVVDRLEFFQEAYDRFAGSPLLGVGVAGIFPEGLTAVHNVYLQVLGELGLLGAAMFALVIGVWGGYLLAVKSSALRIGDDSREWIAICLLAATVLFLMHSFVGHDLGGGEPWLIMGITSAFYSSTLRLG